MSHKISRRTALLAPLGLLPGCSLLDGVFFSNKPPLPGTRIAIMAVGKGLELAKPPRRVVLPGPAVNAEWAQSGGVATHDMGHPALRDVLAPAWRADIGAGGGYRKKITAQPLVSGGRVFVMDSDAQVSGFDAAGGGRLWQTDTQGENDRSTNVGGGIGAEGGMVYAATGRAELLALEAATGKIVWRVGLGSGARSSPTIGDGKIFVLTIDGQLLALDAKDGRRIWMHQAPPSDAAVLGLPAPAFVDGIVVAGFSSGELLALRSNAGAVAWGDSIASPRGRNSLADLSSIRGRPVIKDGQVYAVGLGGLMVALDLRTGRRLWEREVTSLESPWVAGDWIFVLTTDSQLVALARADGGVAWVTQLDRFGNMEKQRDPMRWVGPVLAGDRLVVGSSNGRALAVSPYTGDILGEQKLPGATAVAPSVAGSTLYVLTDDATLTALR